MPGRGVRLDTRVVGFLLITILVLTMVSDTSENSRDTVQLIGGVIILTSLAILYAALSEKMIQSGCMSVVTIVVTVTTWDANVSSLLVTATGILAIIETGEIK